jgi:hypothetical protein
VFSTLSVTLLKTNPDAMYSAPITNTMQPAKTRTDLRILFYPFSDLQCEENIPILLKKYHTEAIQIKF